MEIGLLDTHARLGLDALAQVNLGVHKHRNRSPRQLGVMARQILAAAPHRCGVDGAGVDGTADVIQFRQLTGEWLPAGQRVEVLERPPMREVRAETDGVRR